MFTSSPSSGVSWIRLSFTTFLTVHMQSCTNVVNLCVYFHMTGGIAST